MSFTYTTQATCADKIYSLHIFDVDTGKSVWSDLRAHHGIVYQTRWSLDDKWLLTCSADGSAKIWDTAGLMAAVTRPSSTNAKAFSTHLPYLQCALELSPPCFIYTAVFQDYSHKTPLTLTTSSSSVPRVIIGSNDGRIRVYQETSYIGQLGLKHEEDFHSLAPHSGSVNDLSVDCKSKNLFSADSVGTVLVWRLDTKGWYQILRKLKTDALGIQHVSSLSILSSLALSRALEPTKHSHDLLLLSPPSTVTVFNTSTYRSSNGAFAGLKLPQKGQDAIHGISRAALSADGRYLQFNVATTLSINILTIYALRLAICGSSAPNSPVNIIRIWEVATGNSLHSPISSLSMPYPVRAIAWHPTQHVPLLFLFPIP
jgi:WD40 repeat protein